MHPLDHFLFCPHCGSRRFSVHDVKSKHCADCGFTYYANAMSATAAFITREVDSRRQLLVVRRANEPARGTLDLPGGFVDMEETGEEGICREISEETGLTVAASDLRYLFSLPNLYLYSGMTLHTLDLFYAVDVPPTAVPHPADDASACLWIDIASLNPADFGLRSISRAVERWIRTA